MCLINTVALLGLYFREIPVILHTVGLYMKEETGLRAMTYAKPNKEAHCMPSFPYYDIRLSSCSVP